MLAPASSIPVRVRGKSASASVIYGRDMESDIAVCQSTDEQTFMRDKKWGFRQNALACIAAHRDAVIYRKLFIYIAVLLLQYIAS